MTAASDLEAAAQARLLDALLALKDRAEARALLADLCTPAEVRALAERLEVARLLDEGALSYRAIAERLGASPTTVTRVARFLREEPHGGYRAVLPRLTGQDR